MDKKKAWTKERLHSLMCYSKSNGKNYLNFWSFLWLSCSSGVHILYQKYKLQKKTNTNICNTKSIINHVINIFIFLLITQTYLYLNVITIDWEKCYMPMVFTTQAVSRLHQQIKIVSMSSGYGDVTNTMQLCCGRRSNLPLSLQNVYTLSMLFWMHIYTLTIITKRYAPKWDTYPLARTRRNTICQNH